MKFIFNQANLLKNYFKKFEINNTYKLYEKKIFYRCFYPCSFGVM
jgi:hypothetical protein